MKEKLKLRAASAADIPFLLALRKITMDQHIYSSGLVPTEENHLNRIHYRFDCAQIVQYDGKDAGLLKVVKEGTVWDLVQVQIHPSLQGKGIGQALVADVLAEAYKNKVAVKLSVFKQNPAKKLYDRLGFEISSETESTYEMQTAIKKDVMNIKIDDLKGAEVANLLQEHLDHMYALSPPESVHALDLDELRKPEITFWTIWDAGKLAGCGAIKELSVDHAEIKSMRTVTEFRRRGVAVKLMGHIIAEAQNRNYKRLSLETGPMAYFEPAIKLYESFGFTVCGPFSDYKEDPYSVFMTKEL